MNDLEYGLLTVARVSSNTRQDYMAITIRQRGRRIRVGVELSIEDLMKALTNLEVPCAFHAESAE